MTAPIVSVLKWTSNVATVEIPGAQTFQIRSGRTRVSDLYSAGGATITGIKPENVPTLNVGDLVSIKLDATNGTSFRFVVADYRVDYGPVQSMDTWTLVLEDRLATVGRKINDTDLGSSPGQATAIARSAAFTAGAGFWQWFGGKTIIQPGTLIGQNNLDIFNKCIQSEQGRAYWDGFEGNVYGRDEYIQATQTNPSVILSDDPSDTTAIRYTALEFAGIADDYADRIQVQADGQADVYVGAGSYAYQVQTYLRTASEQTDCGYFVLGQLDIQDKTPNRVSYLMNAGGAMIEPLLPKPHFYQLTFRGNDYTGFVEGWTLSGEVGQQIRVTLNLSAADTYNFFVLDDPIFGRLDYNKLGW